MNTVIARDRIAAPPVVGRYVAPSTATALQALVDRSWRVRRAHALRRRAGAAVLQRTEWKWTGAAWIPQGTPTIEYPPHEGTYAGEIFEDGPAASGPDYGDVEVLENGTRIDWPALDGVMAGVEIGVQVQPSVWRKMRADLSAAISLPNKSHPPHGSNFNRKQRSEQQIADWLGPFQGALADKLTAFFNTRHGLAL